jgi:hypothetical protein
MSDTAVKTVISKKVISSFMEKYNLIKEETDAAIWLIEKNSISTKFRTAAGDFFGQVKFDDVEDFVDIEESIQLPVYESSELQKYINVLGDHIDTQIITNEDNVAFKLKMSDDSGSVAYTLADMAVFTKKTMSKDGQIKYDFTFNITPEFRAKFLNALNAIGETNQQGLANKFVISSNGDTRVLKFITNNNVISINILENDVDVDGTVNAYFRADYLKKILSVNKNATVLFSIKAGKFAEVECTDIFENVTITNNYFLTQVV